MDKSELEETPKKRGEGSNVDNFKWHDRDHVNNRSELHDFQMHVAAIASFHFPLFVQMSFVSPTTRELMVRLFRLCH